MKGLSDEMDTHVQYGKRKAEWKKIIDKGPHTLPYIISNQVYNKDATDAYYISSIQQYNQI
jgi:hypothetical protein